MNKQLLDLILSSFPKDFSEVLKFVKPTIGIKAGEKTQEREATSKFGGSPDIPNGFNWPSFQGKPMAFLCQIVLEEITGYEPSHLLPKTGVLYFFAHTALKDRFPEQTGEFKVMYEDVEKKNLQRAQSANDLMLSERNLKFFQHYTFPSYQDHEMEVLSHKGIELDDFIDENEFEIRELLLGNVDTPCHQILGQPLALQGTVKYWWAAEHSKFAAPYSEKQKTELCEMEKKFHLLLQIDLENENLDIQNYLGDGMAYFGIHQDDLEIQDFSKALLVIQNT